jgi:hypothetical protein
VVITVGDDHLAAIGTVATSLRSRGVKIESILEATGIITGTSTKPASTLEAVPGVKSVEAQPQFQLPPPGSDVQ